MKRHHVLAQLKENKHMIKNDLLSGVTVALALIPESVAFAFVAGVSPILSLQTAVMIGFIAALFTGRPGMISSSTAAIAVVFAALIRTHGLDYLFATVVLMGIIQITIGALRLGKFARIIPHPVMLGFLNGLSIVIFIAQWDQFKINQVTTINGVETVERVWLPSTDLLIMIGFVLLTMLIIQFAPKLTKAVPASLIAIISLTVISVLLSRYGYHLQTVQDFAGMELKGSLPSFYLPRVPLNFETLSIIAPYAFIGALVGLTEAVLTLRVIDEMTNTRGRTNKEIIAQGLANFVNGFFGGMGGDAMIGQSIINIKSGGRTRLSSLVAPITLLIFILFGASFVNVIPLAGLVGVMFMVVVGTFKWESLKYAGKVPRQDILVILIVTILTVFTDLATAVIAGVITSALMFAWEKGRVIYTNNEFEYDGSKIYKINGSIFFGSVLNFKELFTIEDDPDHVVIDFKYAKVMDHSAIEAIHAINGRYRDVGKKVTLIRLSDDCKNIFDNAKDIIHVDIVSNEENPSRYSYV
ncbi:sodium-independent anion transporter [Halolactibacillus miurensis]|uniref:Sodium-independent anion transporter n=2 Tax=Halolactibacillus TaxID=306539 RepID=A0A1I6UXD2_9BACI|nr:SulP family inorganic anion transporter [Halolactibacillus miurensis]GEM05878.1 sodium-independent anion transporter [Halolactibacillus miurensis]SFT06063.1 sulfate permease, SulP family [Halolactibacillus miurensis]